MAKKIHGMKQAEATKRVFQTCKAARQLGLEGSLTHVLVPEDPGQQYKHAHTGDELIVQHNWPRCYWKGTEPTSAHHKIAHSLLLLRILPWSLQLPPNELMRSSKESTCNPGDCLHFMQLPAQHLHPPILRMRAIKPDTNQTPKSPLKTRRIQGNPQVTSRCICNKKHYQISSAC